MWSGAPRTRRWLLRIGAVIVGLDLLLLVIAVPSVSDGGSLGTALWFVVLLAATTLLAVPFLVIGGILWLLELPRRTQVLATGAIVAVSLLAFVWFGDPFSWEYIRCSEAPEALLQQIETQVHPGLSLDGGRVVRSKDHDHVWFVSAEIEGTDPPGVSVSGDIGVWATNRLDSPTPGDEPWLVLSMTTVARESSSWGEGREVPLGPQGTIPHRSDGTGLASRCPR